MVTKPSSESEYTIAAVSKLTGVSCHALRVWERRYGFPVPRRSASGHRRYGHDQVVALRKVSEMAREGRAIGELIAGVKDGSLSVSAEEQPVPQADGVGAEVDEFLERVLAGDLSGGDQAFDRLTARLPADDLIVQVIAPALIETGERWFRRQCSIYQERCASGFLRRKVCAMIESARRENREPRRSILVGTVQGDRHEGGVLVANLLLELAGWRVINLGVDLPVPEYARAVAHFRPDALALSFVLSRNINKRFQELSRIGGLPVFVGGRSILNYQGLARRFGLIPVLGPVTAAVQQMSREVQTWSARPESRGPS